MSAKTNKEYRDIARKKYNGLYSVWESMKNRCSTSKNYNFKYYGSRGINVCQEWKHNFQSFYAWAKDKYKKGLQIDRIDNDGNYEPNNCRFVTHKENVRNCSATKLNVEKVKEIRNLLKEKKLSYRKIGELFNVTGRNIAYIVSGKIWN